MAGFRFNSRRGVRLAFALAFFVATLSGGGGGARAATAVPPRQPLADSGSAGDLAAFSQASITQAPRAPGVEPTYGEPRRDENCTICAAFAAATSILFAPPPLLVLPQLIEFLYQATDAEFMHLRSVSFTARRPAPPAS
jgi:hypothetical protein